MELIIHTLLDNSYSSFLISNYAHHYHASRITNNLSVRYRLIGTDRKTYLDRVDMEELRLQIKHLLSLEITAQDRKIIYGPLFNDLTTSYVTWLCKDFSSEHVEIHVSNQNGLLELTLEGPWHVASLYRVPLLAILSELYTSQSERFSEKTLHQAASFYADIFSAHRFSTSLSSVFIEDSTARRHSSLYQARIFNETLRQNSLSLATASSTNPYLCSIFGLNVRYIPTHEPLAVEAARAMQVHQSAPDPISIGVSSFVTSWINTFQGVHTRAIEPSTYGMSYLVNNLSDETLSKFKFLTFNVVEFGAPHLQAYSAWEKMRGKKDSLSVFDMPSPRTQVPILRIGPSGLSNQQITNRNVVKRIDNSLTYFQSKYGNIPNIAYTPGSLENLSFSTNLQLVPDAIISPFTQPIVILGDNWGSSYAYDKNDYERYKAITQRFSSDSSKKA